MFFAPKLKQTLSDAVGAEKELSRFEYHQLHAPKHGPSRVRFVTNGQQRRAQERYQKAQKRKANKRFRREWMANEAAFVTLGSQLALLRDRPESGLAPGVTKVLEARFGSIDAAVEHFQTLVAERRQ